MKVALEKGEQLEKENAELRETLRTYNGCGDWDNDFHTCRVYLQHEELQDYIEHLTKAKDIIKKMLYEYQRLCLIKKETITEAEQFIKDSEVDK